MLGSCINRFMAEAQNIALNFSIKSKNGASMNGLHYIEIITTLPH